MNDKTNSLIFRVALDAPGSPYQIIIWENVSPLVKEKSVCSGLPVPGLKMFVHP